MNCTCHPLSCRMQTFILLDWNCINSSAHCPSFFTFTQFKCAVSDTCQTDRGKPISSLGSQDRCRAHTNTERTVFTMLPHRCVSHPSRGTTWRWQRVVQYFFGLFSSEAVTGSYRRRDCVGTYLPLIQGHSICHRTITELPAANDLPGWPRKELETWRLRGCKAHYKSSLSCTSYASCYSCEDILVSKNQFSSIDIELPVCHLLFKNANRLSFSQHLGSNDLLKLKW